MLVATVGFICVASGTYRDHFAAATPPPNNIEAHTASND